MSLAECRGRAFAEQAPVKQSFALRFSPPLAVNCPTGQNLTPSKAKRSFALLPRKRSIARQSETPPNTKRQGLFPAVFLFPVK
jgi:hypothetical protein